MCTIYAEEEGITGGTYYEMPEVHVFGSTFKDMFRRVIEKVGNYGEIYSTHMEPYVSREDTKINKLNENDGPQHFVLF